MAGGAEGNRTPDLCSAIAAHECASIEKTVGNGAILSAQASKSHSLRYNAIRDLRLDATASGRPLLLHSFYTYPCSTSSPPLAIFSQRLTLTSCQGAHNLK